MPLAALPLGIGVLACGQGDTAPSRASSSDATTVASPDRGSLGRYWRQDGDTDFDDDPRYSGDPPNDDLGLLANYGPPASSATRAAVAAVVKRYYAASVTGDAPTVCSLLAASVATGIAAERNQDATPNTCVTAMSKLLVRQHSFLASEGVATMTVTAVRVRGNIGLAVLAFRTAPQSDIAVEREGTGWKVDALFGSYMT